MLLTTDFESCWVSHSALLKVNRTIFQSLIGFYLLVSWTFFLLEVTGYLINHHFKVAWVICIQIHTAAGSTDTVRVCVVADPGHEEPQQPGAGGRLWHPKSCCCWPGSPPSSPHEGATGG